MTVEEKIIGVMYAVYEGRVLSTSTDEVEIIYTTQALQKAIAYANKYQGVVYSYDITELEDYINETFVYDGTKA